MANVNDPRKGNTSRSVNEILKDRIIRHLLYLTRLSTQEANWIREQLQAGLFPDLMDQVSAGAVRLQGMAGETNLITQAQSRELRRIVSRLDRTNTSFFKELQINMIDRLAEISESEAEFTSRLFRKTIPVEWNFSELSKNQLESLLKTQPFDGKPLSEWFDGLSRSNTERITQAIRQGMIQGESIDDIVLRIRGTPESGFTDGILQTTTNHAEALARSGVMFASDQANTSFFRQNEDLIKGVEIVITLDSRTCLECVSAAEQNPYDLDKAPMLPLHVRCRCAKVAVTKSWRELGIDLDEAPEGTRASMDGQVPEGMSYNEWLRLQEKQGNIDIIEEALGKKRAEEFLAGKSVSSFTDRQGRTLSLTEIRRRESDVLGDATATDQVGRVSDDIDEHRQQIAEYYETLDRRQTNAIQNYTGAHYTYINRGLRTGSDIPEMFQKTHDDLLEAMQRAPRYEGRVWRGINTDSRSLFREFAGYEPGDSMTDNAWFSASLKESVARDFASYDSFPYEIILNVRAKNAVNVSELSLSRHEQELLLKPGSRFNVLSKSVHGNRVTLEIEEY